jgi:dienelactone hydrolase
MNVSGTTSIVIACDGTWNRLATVTNTYSFFATYANLDDFAYDEAAAVSAWDEILRFLQE